MRLHKKIWLWWGKWWAVQFSMLDDGECFVFGIRHNCKRPLLDIYLGSHLTISFGRHAVYTDPRTRHWDSCRGMLFPDDARFPSEEAQKLFDPRVL